MLSGPTFAHEVAAGLPTAVTLAVRGPGARRARWPRGIARPCFRPYLSDDVAGAEIGGAVKNVLAIACGVVEGRGLGQNARAALISRGFAEMTRFGLAKGARAETLAGLAGLGDLVLTCSSTSSRNFSLGKGIGEGARPADLLADRRTVAEGAFTAPVLQRAAAALGVDMPIVAAVMRLLAEEARWTRWSGGCSRGRCAAEGVLEIPAMPLILPIAVAGRLPALGAAAFLLLLRRRGLGHGRARREVGGRLHMGRAFGHAAIPFEYAGTLRRISAAMARKAR